MEPTITNFKNVIEKESEFIKRIPDSIFSKYLLNDNYEPIFRILVEGPKTLSDIYTIYNPFYMSIILKKDKTSSESSKKQKAKTENTIYKYVKKLMEVGLVIEAGIQIDLAKSSTVTKTLYQLSASYFIPDDRAYDIFNSDMGNLLTEIIGVFISPHFNDKFPVISEFKTFIANRYQAGNEKLLNFFRKFEKTHTDLGEEYKTYHEAYNLLNTLSAKNYMRFFGIFRKLLVYFDADQTELNAIGKIFTQQNSSTLKDSTVNVIDESDSQKTIIKNDNFKQQLIMDVSEEDWKKYLDKLAYSAIIRLLKTKAMTVHDIYAKHYETMKAIYDRQCIIADEYGKEMICEEPTEIKSETTVYRYIKELEDAGYLAEAGRLYTPETKSSQILYARTGKIFILYHDDLEIFESDDGDNLLKALTLYLKLYLNKSASDISKVKTNLLKLINSSNEAILNVYREVKHDSIIEATRNLNPNELDLVLTVVTFFEFFLHADKYESQEIITNIKKSFR